VSLFCIFLLVRYIGLLRLDKGRSSQVR
jgi:hypothetical protein